MCLTFIRNFSFFEYSFHAFDKRIMIITKFVPFLFHDGKGEMLTVNGIDMCVCVKRTVLQVWKTGGVLKPDASPLITGCFAEAALTRYLRLWNAVTPSNFVQSTGKRGILRPLTASSPLTTGIIKRRTQYISFATITNESIFISTINHKDMDGFFS